MPDAADWQAELAELEALSARIGADPLLTQGAGGNTSLKIDGTLWIKASGTWLAHALERRIMVPVEIEPLLGAVHSVDPAAERIQQLVENQKILHRFPVDEGTRPILDWFLELV